MPNDSQFDLLDAKEVWVNDMLENNTKEELVDKIWSLMSVDQQIRELQEIQSIYSEQ